MPGSSLVTTLIVLNAIGLGPHAVSGIALVLGVDRLLDMFRTTVNVTSSLTCAAYVARAEKETRTRTAAGAGQRGRLPGSDGPAGSDRSV